MADCRVLVVEDEAIIAMDVESQIRAIGCGDVHIVYSAPEALTRARAMSPHLIIMDIHLSSDMTGLEAAEQLRQEMEVPIIFLTGNIELVENASILHHAVYTRALSKPVPRPVFKAQVEEALRSRSA